MANQVACDSHLKSIALALDSYRQEKGHFPEKLQELAERNYLWDMSALHCPEDPVSEGNYDAFYVQRGPHDPRGLPALVCPFHESRSVGAQVYLDRQVQQFASRPAILTASTSTTITRPGQAPVTAVGGLQLHGADVLQTGEQGSALITFADGSTAQMQANTQLTILQSFVEGRAQSLIYTLVKQALGTIRYRVHHGSKFDVSTPTATTAALGTDFTITVNTTGANGPQMSILLTTGKVRISTVKRSALAPLGSLYTIDGTNLQLPGLLPGISIPGGLPGGGLPGGGLPGGGLPGGGLPGGGLPGGGLPGGGLPGGL